MAAQAPKAGLAYKLEDIARDFAEQHAFELTEKPKLPHIDDGESNLYADFYRDNQFGTAGFHGVHASMNLEFMTRTINPPFPEVLHIEDSKWHFYALARPSAGFVLAEIVEKHVAAALNSRDIGNLHATRIYPNVWEGRDANAFAASKQMKEPIEPAKYSFFVESEHPKGVIDIIDAVFYGTSFKDKIGEKL